MPTVERGWPGGMACALVLLPPLPDKRSTSAWGHLHSRACGTLAGNTSVIWAPFWFLFLFTMTESLLQNVVDLYNFMHNYFFSVNSLLYLSIS